MIGAFADRYGRGYGRRRLWTAIAVPITMVGVYLTFIPPAGAGPLYLLLAVVLVYLGWTMATIAYGAWGAEASADYKERTRITGVREMFAFVGILVASLAPLYSGGGPGSANGFAPLMSTLGWIVLILLPPSAAQLNSKALQRVTQAAFGQRRKMLRQSLKSLGVEPSGAAGGRGNPTSA